MRTPRASGASMLSARLKSELAAGELEGRRRRVAADVDEDLRRGGEADLAALVRAALVGAAVVRGGRRLAADADVEVGVRRAGHLEGVGAGGERRRRELLHGVLGERAVTGEARPRLGLATAARRE